MYAKLFSSMFTGSLATRGPWEAVVTFQQFLVLADRFGIVDMTPESIARHTTIPLDIINKGIEALEQPDPQSRRPDLEGRRIVRLDPLRGWGWEIVNHAHYRQIRSAEERRNYQREYMQEYRKGARRTRKAAPKGNGADRAPVAPSAPLVIPEWIDADTFAAWIKIRPAKARTPEAQAAAIGKLDKMRGTGVDVNEVLRTSLANGWQGIFAPDAKRAGQAAQQRSEPGSAPRPSFKCADCGARVETWIGQQCFPCYRGEKGAPA